MEWLNVGASVAMVGAPEITVGEVTTDSWSSMGIDAYAVAKYPVAETVGLQFSGEYLSLGQVGAEVEGVDQIDGSAMIFALDVNFETGSDAIQAVRPALRYETFSPMAYGEETEDNSDRHRLLREPRPLQREEHASARRPQLRLRERECSTATPTSTPTGG